MKELFLAVFLTGGVSVTAADIPVYQQLSASVEERVEDLFGRLTEDEKLSLLGGNGFTTQPIQRLEVPAMVMADAGQGVRGGPDYTLGPATAFPAGVLMGCTWDTNLLRQIGQAIGVEARNKGTGSQVLLGPAVNIHRSPLGGRNAEYFTEDPYLNAQLAVAYIRGMQNTGVSACIKHFLCNNQETDRGSVNVKISERALREIYLPAFKAGVQQGGVWSLMTSYNKINGFHASANRYLLTDVLKEEWGFDGVVISDWGGVHETTVVQDGNDLEMPVGDQMSVSKLKDAMAKGSITQTAVDDSVRRILRTMIRVRLLNGPMRPDRKLVNSPDHAKLALQAAEEGIVLLKNEGRLLPLDSSKLTSIAVIGEPAKYMQFDAAGSPEVQPTRVVEFLDGIKARAGNVEVHYANGSTDGEPLPLSSLAVPDDKAMHGYRAEYFTNRDLKGQPAIVRVEEGIDVRYQQLPATGFPKSDFSVRWTTRLTAPTSGKYAFTFTGDDGFRVFLNEKLLIDHWELSGATPRSAQPELQAGKSYDLRIEYFQGGGDYMARFRWQPPQTTRYADAISAAKNADIAIVAVSTQRKEGEGSDRPSMDLPNNQADLIRAVAAVNKHTVVVLNNGTPVTLKDWLPEVPAVIETWFPGQEGGTALASILFGDVNPSGKLSDTLAANRIDYPDAENFPGKNEEVHYAEDIYVGYRYFDKASIEPLFPFGHGLSYTTFDYSQMKLSTSELNSDGAVTASVDISNTGKRAGAEVVQLYIHDLNPKVDRPIRELKGFSKVRLQPGETKTVHFQISPSDLAYFDEIKKQWTADSGEYEVQIGASSRDIRQRAHLRLDRDYIDKLPGS